MIISFSVPWTFERASKHALQRCHFFNFIANRKNEKTYLFTIIFKCNSIQSLSARQALKCIKPCWHKIFCATRHLAPTPRRPKPDGGQPRRRRARRPPAALHRAWPQRARHPRTRGRKKTRLSVGSSRVWGRVKCCKIQVALGQGAAKPGPAPFARAGKAVLRKRGRAAQREDTYLRREGRPLPRERLGRPSRSEASAWEDAARADWGCVNRPCAGCPCAAAAGPD